MIELRSGDQSGFRHGRPDAVGRSWRVAGFATYNCRPSMPATAS